MYTHGRTSLRDYICFFRFFFSSHSTPPGNGLSRKQVVSGCPGHWESVIAHYPSHPCTGKPLSRSRGVKSISIRSIHSTDLPRSKNFARAISRAALAKSCESTWRELLLLILRLDKRKTLYLSIPPYTSCSHSMR